MGGSTRDSNSPASGWQAPKPDHEMTPSEAPPHRQWHALSVAEALAALGSGETGLSEAQAARRRQRWGPNESPAPTIDPWWCILGRQLRSIVMLLLAVAALAAAAFGERAESAAIGVVLLINLAIGFVIELRARFAMEALQRLEVPRATVVRGGREQSVAARDLVVGDVVLLTAGDAVPADARLLERSELQTVEAMLTGESLPVVKSPRPVAGDTVLAERTSMVYRATLIASGTGRAVVVATGGATELGQVSDLLSSIRREPTPLERQLNVLGRRMVWATLAVAMTVVAVGIARGLDLWLMVETGLALAIAAVPEGLPVVTTITLALGVQRMARRNALIRRLPTVETLGSATVVCTDKTGTLTSGRMAVTTMWIGERELEVRPGESFFAAGEPVEPSAVPGLLPLLTTAALANRAVLAPAGGGEGDPTEVALLEAARLAGIERGSLRQEEVGEVPFSSERMLMATFQRSADGSVVAHVKGAPRRLVELSSSWVGGEGRVEPLDDEGRQRLLEANRRLARRGLRVLAVASRRLGPNDKPAAAALDELTFSGFIGLLDPPSPGVAETVKLLRDAGVRSVMLTGDQALTAEAVGRSLGILRAEERILDGHKLQGVDKDDVGSLLRGVGGLSRVSPKNKLHVVRAFQAAGEVVAMLGDGVNDAPALRRADIGVAMGGRGTDVAREAADIVLADDRFGTVAAAVHEGRVVFDNIRRFIFYLFSCNLSEILLLFIAGIAGLPLPLLPLQLLWLNLVTDVFPALALAVEPAAPGVMSRPPRPPDEGILTGAFLARISGYGGLLTGLSLAVFIPVLAAGGEPRARTAVFATLAFSQLIHLFNARSDGRPLSLRRFFANRWALGAIALVLVLQLAALYLPALSGPLGTVPLTAIDWLAVILASLAPLAIGQAVAVVRSVRTRRGTSEPAATSRNDRSE